MAGAAGRTADFVSARLVGLQKGPEERAAAILFPDSCIPSHFGGQVGVSSMNRFLTGAEDFIQQLGLPCRSAMADRLNACTCSTGMLPRSSV